jgi:hypothetical protein
MLDFELAEIYEVKTKVLNQAVKRNLKRFPSDFMFQITNQEFENLRSHFVTSSWGGSRYLPYAFTEHGITMLASVLNSDKAIDVNLQIVRAFTALRQFIVNYAELKMQLDNFMVETNVQFGEIYQTLSEYAEQKKLENKQRIPIGFR